MSTKLILLKTGGSYSLVMSDYPKKICVVGLRYIGLPTVSIFATNGFHVDGVDINPSPSKEK